MAYQVVNDAGKKMDAHAEIDPNGLTLRSRGGSAATGILNADYSDALRLLLRRLANSKIPFQRAWVDSIDVQNLSISERKVLESAELEEGGSSVFKLLTSRMKSVGQAEGAKGGNSTKRLRIQFSDPISLQDLETTLHLVRAEEDPGDSEKLADTELEKVTPDYLWSAVEALHNPDFNHPFRRSEHFELVTETGTRFAPKAVFGVAASEALGFEVNPKQFNTGSGSLCFRILKRAGFLLVPKGEKVPAGVFPTTPEDREWSEGKPKLVKHLKRERASGLAEAKRKHFLQAHGRLYCERCEMDPVKVYGDTHGVACIEVHHEAIHVEDMPEEHRTKLEDLRCLCANCHRYVHRLLKLQIANMHIA